MANNLYTTKTASLKATKIDARVINGKIIKVNDKDVVTGVTIPDTREMITENDLWSSKVEIIDGEIVFTTTELVNPNGFLPWKPSIKLVEGNKAHDNLGFYCNIETDQLVSGDYMFSGSNCQLTEWKSDLPKLERGYQMFYGNTALTTFQGDMPSLVGDGTQVEGSCVDSMFSYSGIKKFKGNMNSLTKGSNMFSYSTLGEFEGDMKSLTDGTEMFYNCSNLSGYSGDLSSLENGTDMFNGCMFGWFEVDMPKLKTGTRMFKNCNLNGFKYRMDELRQGEEMFAYCNLSSFSSKIDGLVWAKNMFYGNGRMTFVGDLYTLNEGYGMFEETWLDIESLTHIAETIMKIQRNITIGLQYDIDLVEAKKLLTEITNKGWTVYTYLEHHNGKTNQIAIFNPEDGYISGEDDV